jgi:hypothetical protein
LNFQASLGNLVKLYPDQTAGAQRNSSLNASDPRNEYVIKAERAREQAQLLRELISTRRRLGVP